MTETHEVNDWRIEYRSRGSIVVWACRSPLGEVFDLTGTGEEYRECFDPRVEVRTRYWPEFVQVTGTLVEVNDAPVEQWPGRLIAWLPIADPTAAMVEAVERANTVRAAISAQYAADDARTAERAKLAAAERERQTKADLEARAEGYWWVMDGATMYIDPTEPGPLPGIHKGLRAAKAALGHYLDRRYFGCWPGSWVQARMEWRGYSSPEDAEERGTPSLELSVWSV